MVQHRVEPHAFGLPLGDQRHMFLHGFRQLLVQGLAFRGPQGLSACRQYRCQLGQAVGIAGGQAQHPCTRQDAVGVAFARGAGQGLGDVGGRQAGHAFASARACGVALAGPGLQCRQRSGRRPLRLRAAQGQGQRTLRMA